MYRGRDEKMHENYHCDKSFINQFSILIELAVVAKQKPISTQGMTTS